jgi:hypothetical protein
MSGLLASFLGVVVREVEAFKAVTSQGDISAVVGIPLHYESQLLTYVGAGLGLHSCITAP